MVPSRGQLKQVENRLNSTVQDFVKDLHDLSTFLNTMFIHAILHGALLFAVFTLLYTHVSVLKHLPRGFSALTQKNQHIVTVMEIRITP